MKTSRISILVLILALAACSPAAAQGEPSPGPEPASQPAGAETSTPPTPTTYGNTEMSPTLPPPMFDDTFGGIAAEARNDLARRLGLTAGDITVTAVIGQEFTEDAFYCRASKDRIPRDAPAESISGLVILLKAGERRYEYHAREGEIVFCRMIP